MFNNFNYFYDRKEDNNCYAFSNQYLDEIEGSNILKMRQNQLNSIARSDLVYNFNFIPVYQTGSEKKYTLSSASIYINNFWINGIKVIFLPTEFGISLSLAPGRYSFKVEYVISNYYETCPYYWFDNRETFYTPKVNERKILEIKDVYIDETSEYYLCLANQIQANIKKYYNKKNQVSGCEFLSWTRYVDFSFKSRETLEKYVDGSIDASLYPHHYALNRDYSSYNFKNGLYDMVYAKTYKEFNKPYKISKKDGKLWSYYGPFVDGLPEGNVYCNNIDEGFEFMGNFYKGETLGNGATFYKNGEIAYGFNTNYFKKNGPCLYFYPSGNFEYVMYKDNKKIKGILVLKDNSTRLTSYDEYQNASLREVDDKYLNIIHECITFKEYQTFKRVEYDYGSYIGELNDSSLPHGIGCINFKNGNRYCGTFFNGSIQGYGVFYYPNGSYVTAPFINGLANGQGRIYKSNCSPKFVYYKNNKIEKTFWFDKDNIEYNTSSKSIESEKVNNSSINKSTSNNIVSSKDTKTSETNKKTVPDKIKTTIKYDNGAYYEGEINAKLEFHGKGKYVFENGDIYEGDFLNSKRTGNGTYLYKNGDKYVGSFLNGERHGKGTFYFRNGDKYIGDFKNDSRSGKATYVWNDGEKYEGDFIDGYIIGQGTYFYKNGNKYVGSFLKSKRDGEGTYYYANGEKHVGTFKDNKKHGNGKYYDKSGNLIKSGKWIDDVYDDPNKIKHNFIYENAVIGPNDKEFYYGNCVYVGLHKDNKPHLLGTFYFNDGITYSGAHFNLKSDNFGILVYKDASYYVGEFIDDKKEGFGLEITDENHFNFGFRKNGVDDGIKVVITYRGFSVYMMENGKLKDILYNGFMIYDSFVELKLPYNFAYFGQELYIGQFNGRNRHGFGKLLMNEDVYIGQFVNDDFSGIGCYKFSDGITYIGQFKNGAMSGIGVVFDRYGNVNVKRYENNQEIEKLY